MGCWNATCNISNLPISYKDKVVMIPLIKIREKTVFNCCNPEDNFVPMGFPIRGTYDEYGAIENISTPNFNKEFLMKQKFFYENRDNDGSYRPADYDNFEDLVSQVLCCHEGAYVSVSKSQLHPTGFAEINFMMIHQDLYDSIVNEIANRVPVYQNDNLRICMLDKYRKILQKGMSHIQKNNGMLIGVSDAQKEKTQALVDAFNFSTYNDMTHDIFCGTSFFQTPIWQPYTKRLVSVSDSEREEILNYAVEKYLFTVALSYMRKGYLCDCGAGSQSNEMRLHMLLAQFIRDYVEHTAVQDMEIGNIADHNGIQESVYFWDND